MELMALSEDRIELDNIEVNKLINNISSKIILKDIKLKIEVEEANIIADRYLIEVVIRNQ